MVERKIPRVEEIVVTACGDDSICIQQEDFMQQEASQITVPLEYVDRLIEHIRAVADEIRNGG